MTSLFVRSTMAGTAGVVLAVLAFAGSVIPANAANVLMVREKVVLSGTPDDIWAKIGGFCAIADWNPAVKGCVDGTSEDRPTRTLTLDAGGVVTEAKTEGAEKTYRYEVIEGDLPVEHFKGSFKLKARGEGRSMLIWSASFAAKGKDDAEAKAAVEAIIKAGIESLKAKFPAE